LGTFFLVVAGCGAIVVDRVGTGPRERGTAPLASALALPLGSIRDGSWLVRTNFDRLWRDSRWIRADFYWIGSRTHWVG
jgi:hypothetical protein